MTETTELLPRVVALVPAKMTSQRLPRKNMALLAGEPLFVHAVRVALRAKSIADIFVSTESDELTARARGEPCHVIRRPPGLSDPKTSNIEVMKHALDDMRRSGFDEPALIVLLQPSHPFRVPDEIDIAISRMLADPSATSLISVAPVNKAVGTINGGLWDVPNSLGPSAKEKKAALYANRGAFAIFRTSLTTDDGRTYGDRVLAHELARPEIDIDIDTAWDLELAKAILARHPDIAGYLN